jgi:nucleotide-binding universal stress UspA family protein
MAAILVPVDGSDCSLRALDVASDFAARLGAGIVVCHVVDLSRAAAMSGGEPQLIAGCLEELHSEAKDIIDRAVARVAPGVAASARTVEGTPVEEIEQLACELAPAFIVVGSHGRTGLDRLMMGSVAEGVVRAAAVPVMVVPCGHGLKLGSQQSAFPAPKP